MKPEIIELIKWVLTIVSIILGIIIFSELAKFIHHIARKIQEGNKVLSYYLEGFLIAITLIGLILWFSGFKLEIEEHLTLINIAQAIGIFVGAAFISWVIIWAYNKFPPVQEHLSDKRGGASN